MCIRDSHWWVNTDSVGIYYASNTDPVWTFDLPALNAALWHRVRPAQVFSVRAPANLIDGGDEDHVLVVVNGTTYYQAGPTWYKPYFGSSGVYYEVVPAP